MLKSFYVLFPSPLIFHLHGSASSSFFLYWKLCQDVWITRVVLQPELHSPVSRPWRVCSSAKENTETFSPSSRVMLLTAFYILKIRNWKCLSRSERIRMASLTKEGIMFLFLFPHMDTVYFWGSNDAEKEQIFCKDCAHSTGEIALPPLFKFVGIKIIFLDLFYLILWNYWRLFFQLYKEITIFFLMRRWQCFVRHHKNEANSEYKPRGLKLHPAVTPVLILLWFFALSNETRRTEGGLEGEALEANWAALNKLL